MTIPDPLWIGVLMALICLLSALRTDRRSGRRH